MDRRRRPMLPRDRSRVPRTDRWICSLLKRGQRCASAGATGFPARDPFRDTTSSPGKKVSTKNMHRGENKQKCTFLCTVPHARNYKRKNLNAWSCNHFQHNTTISRTLCLWNQMLLSVWNQCKAVLWLRVIFVKIRIWIKRRTQFQRHLKLFKRVVPCIFCLFMFHIIAGFYA